MSAGKIRIDVSDCNSFKVLRSPLDRLSLGAFGILKCKAYFFTHHVSLFFFKILYCIFYSSYNIFIRHCFRSNCEVKALGKDICFDMGNCLKDILITHFFLSVMLVALCVTLFLLIDSSNFRMSLFC